MKLHYLKSLSAIALAGMFAMNAYAETQETEHVIDFTKYEVGSMLNSFYGGPQEHMKVVATDEGNLLLIDGQTISEDGVPALNDAGLPSWSTMARIEAMALPKGYNFSNVTLIEVVYKPTQDDNVPFAIQLKNDTNPLKWELPVEVNEWNTLAFDPDDFTTGGEDDLAQYVGTPSSFDFCMGANGSSNYYIKSVTFYLMKEVTQREKDEAALDKNTAACVQFDFDEWPVSAEVDGAFSSPYLGSLRMSVNRPDMIIDKGPEDYNNNCAHIIYQGWTTIWITEPVNVPEGYTFDDLRLVEYDIYESDIPGIDMSNGSEASGRNGAPNISVRDIYNWGWWAPLGDNGCSAGNAQLPTVNEWHHVEFYPSAFAWQARDFEEPVLDAEGQPVLDADGNEVKNQLHWEADEAAAEFGKLNKFHVSIGFFPCVNQTYVDNVKFWFQKGGEDNAVDAVSAAQVADSAIYNVFGQRVDESYRGIVIKNGKKYINK